MQEFIETPIQPYRVGRTYLKMSQSKTTQAETPKAPKAKYAKSRGEHIKDVVIAMLITGIVSFIGGMSFQNKQQDAIETAVNAVMPAAQAQEVKK